MQTAEEAIEKPETIEMAAEELTGAEMVVRILREENVECMFGYPGGTILPIYDTLERTDIYHVLTSHEQGAVHAADGYARVSGKPGVVSVTSGPGATNTVTGLQTAMADSSPLVVITGQVPTKLIGTEAFQECDIVSITKTCTKWNYQVRDIDELAHALREAFATAREGRPGPVLIDIPKDIQLAKGPFRAACGDICDPLRKKPDAALIAEAARMMEKAERPVFYVGGGIVRSGEDAAKAFRALAQETGFPVTSTLMGLGVYPGSGSQWLKMLGMHGSREANEALHRSDLIVAIGARFDDRAICALDTFAPDAKVVHIDIDPSSSKKFGREGISIAADCREALTALLKTWRGTESASRAPGLGNWWDQIDAVRAENSMAYPQTDEIVQPQFVMEKLNEALKGRNFYIVTDVGQNQMWAAQYLKMEEPGRLVTSGGMGTMGFGMPAAMGVVLAKPEADVVCICGDGGFQMTSPEMATAAAEGLPVKVILFNNRGLGMVRQVNELTHKKRYPLCTEKTQPDFMKLAQAYGWTGLQCASPKDVEASLTQLMNSPGPCVLEIAIDPGANCLPMGRPGGAGYHDMLTHPPAP
ncbi:MAG: biosynthetic-type acetolactate synthase large subunit [Alphaproteobacteria bacterium]|nr:biosynthetic-type acetolactate synthase large subunit [Alphaproteobacteria bacterium]